MRESVFSQQSYWTLTLTLNSVWLPRKSMKKNDTKKRENPIIQELTSVRDEVWKNKEKKGTATIVLIKTRRGERLESERKCVFSER